MAIINKFHTKNIKYLKQCNQKPVKENPIITFSKKTNIQMKVFFLRMRFFHKKQFFKKNQTKKTYNPNHSPTVFSKRWLYLRFISLVYFSKKYFYPLFLMPFFFWLQISFYSLKYLISLNNKFFYNKKFKKHNKTLDFLSKLNNKKETRFLSSIKKICGFIFNPYFLLILFIIFLGFKSYNELLQKNDKPNEISKIFQEYKGINVSYQSEDNITRDFISIEKSKEFSFSYFLNKPESIYLEKNKNVLFSGTGLNSSLNVNYVNDYNGSYVLKINNEIKNLMNYLDFNNMSCHRSNLLDSIQKPFTENIVKIKSNINEYKHRTIIMNYNSNIDFEKYYINDMETHYGKITSETNYVCNSLKNHTYTKLLDLISKNISNKQ